MTNNNPKKNHFFVDPTFFFLGEERGGGGEGKRERKWDFSSSRIDFNRPIEGRTRGRDCDLSNEF